MSKRNFQIALIMLFGGLSVSVSGCAEGIFWRTGHLAPWVRRTWAEEEQIAATLFTRKQQMNDAVEAAALASESRKNEVASELQSIINRDPVVLLRIHAVSLLGELNCAQSVEALQTASTDQNTKIRIAAARSLGKQPAAVALPILQEMIGSDTNGDVRLAATQSVGLFSNSQSLSALALAIEDKDPALQLAAIESLEKVTGEKLGPDVFAWKRYLTAKLPTNSPSRVAQQGSSKSSSEELQR